MFQVVRKMHEMWEVGDVAAGHSLHQFILEYVKLCAMPANVVWQIRARGPKREGEETAFV
jgi:hypothetical protein